jgi:FdhD protein
MLSWNGKPLTDPISPTERIQVTKTGATASVSDHVVGEEPLEIRIDAGVGLQQLAITMRTPGADIELGAGFLWTEGLLRTREDLIGITTCKDKELTPREQENVIVARVVPDAPAVSRTLERRFTITSACGVCGSTHIEDLRQRGCANVSEPGLSDDALAKLPDLMRPKQKIFDKTGGLHAAGLFDPNGNLIVVREDVGRHNAVDKVIGYALMNDLLPLQGYALAISGRGGFEIIQKAIAAGISAVVAVSAPTSLAVETAREFGLTLLGFARNGEATKYSPAPIADLKN